MGILYQIVYFLLIVLYQVSNIVPRLYFTETVLCRDCTLPRLLYEDCTVSTGPSDKPNISRQYLDPPLAVTLLWPSPFFGSHLHLAVTYFWQSHTFGSYLHLAVTYFWQSHTFGSHLPLVVP